MMNSIFQFPSYLLKRQVLALTGKFRVYDPMGNLVMFSEQKMFRLREDIRVYSDESKSQEVLSIKARQILDFSAAYDVVDTALNQKVGVLRRKGLRSLLRDEWQVLDANDNQIGQLFEDSVGLALLRRFVLGAWLPQNYDLTVGGTRVADLKQNFHLFRYELNLDFSMDISHQLDRRIGIAAGISARGNRRKTEYRVIPMAKQPLFAGLVFDEYNHAADTALIGDEPCYVVDDAGFRRHIPSAQVDRQVLDHLAEMMKGSEDLLSEQAAKMLGQEDVFTVAAIQQQLKNMDKQFDQLMQVGLPEDMRCLSWYDGV